MCACFSDFPWQCKWNRPLHLETRKEKTATARINSRQFQANTKGEGLPAANLSLLDLGLPEDRDPFPVWGTGPVTLCLIAYPEYYSGLP